MFYFIITCGAGIFFFFFVLKLLAGCIPEKGMCCVIFTVTCGTCAFQSNSSDLSKKVLSYILVVWGDQYISNSFKLACTANQT